MQLSEYPASVGGGNDASRYSGWIVLYQHCKQKGTLVAYARSLCVDLAATLVAGTFLLLDLRPLVHPARVRSIKCSSLQLSMDGRAPYCDPHK